MFQFQCAGSHPVVTSALFPTSQAAHHKESRGPSGFWKVCVRAAELCFRDSLNDPLSDFLSIFLRHGSEGSRSAAHTAITNSKNSLGGRHVYHKTRSARLPSGDTPR